MAKKKPTKEEEALAKEEVTQDQTVTTVSPTGTTVTNN